MLVNDSKTQLLCITTAINYDVRAQIKVGDEIITSADTLKIVGFTFGRRPGAAAHVKALRRKYGVRAHIIRHLKQKNMDCNPLVKIYCSLIKPIFEYGAPAFHTMLMAEQGAELERMQRMTLKTIFGWDVLYTECLSLAGMVTLHERRENLFQNFTRKPISRADTDRGGLPPTQPQATGLGEKMRSFRSLPAGIGSNTSLNTR